MKSTPSGARRRPVVISAEALAEARAADAEVHRPLREANERSRRWLDVARHAQACREYAEGGHGYLKSSEPHLVLVEQSGHRGPTVDPRTNLYVSRRWVREFWVELLGYLRPMMTKDAVAALVVPAGYREQAKLAFEAVKGQFLRLIDGVDGAVRLQKEVVKAVFDIRNTLGADRSMCGGFFYVVEATAREGQAAASADAGRIETELRERMKRKVAPNAPPTTPKSSASDQTDEPPRLTHSEDFASVNWYGTEYTFTKRQAVVVELLWKDRENGGGALKEETIGEKVHGDRMWRFRLRDTFRNGGKLNPAWNTMIVSPSRGVYALAPPPRQKPT